MLSGRSVTQENENYNVNLVATRGAIRRPSENMPSYAPLAASKKSGERLTSSFGKMYNIQLSGEDRKSTITTVDELFQLAARSSQARVPSRMQIIAGIGRATA